MSSSPLQLPRPTSRDAPRFNEDEPENLRRFFNEIDDLFDDFNIVDDRERKRKIVRYADARSEDEWKMLDEYSDGSSYSDFKKAILANYPEAFDAETGTLSRLNRIVNEVANIEASERDIYLKFKRRFLTESKKLMMPPAIVTNRELVERFLSRLEYHFRETIVARLSIKHGMKLTTTAAVEILRREDLYPLAEVIEEADEIVLSGIAFSPVSPGQKTVEKNKIDEVKNELHSLMDRLTSNEKLMEQRHEELLRRAQTSSTSQPGQNILPVRLRSEPKYWPSNGMKVLKCWYDHIPGHSGKSCSNLQSHLHAGLLKTVAGRVVLWNGMDIPFAPSAKSPYERVLDYYHECEAVQMLYEDRDIPMAFDRNTPRNGRISQYANEERDERDEIIERMNHEVQLLKNNAMTSAMNSRRAIESDREMDYTSAKQYIPSTRGLCLEYPIEAMNTATSLLKSSTPQWNIEVIVRNEESDRMLAFEPIEEVYEATMDLKPNPPVCEPATEAQKRQIDEELLRAMSKLCTEELSWLEAAERVESTTRQSDSYSMGEIPSQAVIAENSREEDAKDDMNIHDLNDIGPEQVAEAIAEQPSPVPGTFDVRISKGQSSGVGHLSGAFDLEYFTDYEGYSAYDSGYSSDSNDADIEEDVPRLGTHRGLVQEPLGVG
ncbi:hypothetical protein EDD18DRAFT_1365874 [Armillaria luteobubalina]|uniref:Uncharacterized protein n=1 Tax=Armillaria luteobubalina TaxID=153913 RepID=A0AA39U8G8_9AGAR|nr:hypothetical protein EDD18DRAFT_1365874 [Armillaria luteobubalina]